MSISTKKHMHALARKLDCFGCFEVSYLSIDRSGECQVLSSLQHKQSSLDPLVLSRRFFHFIQLMQPNCSKFFSEKTDCFYKTPFDKTMHYVAFVKKTCSNKVKIYLFHAPKRFEVVHLLLHKDVVKRMALYMDENIKLKRMYCCSNDLKYLFDAEKNKNSNIEVSQNYLHSVFDGLLTKKEKKLVCSYLQSHSIREVSDVVGFSRSYVSQLLLSSAHKLGLSKIHDILAIDKTRGVLLRAGE